MRISSHPLKLSGALVAAAFATFAPAVACAQQQVDVLIRGGTVVDGSGSAQRRADVGIRGDRVTFVGDAAASRVSGAKTVDATGMIVAPGFIDPHTHTEGDLTSPQRKSNIPYLMQGVTTVVTNNDGQGPTVLGPLLAGWQKNGIGTNAAVYIGQGSVRRAVMGMSDAKPTPVQMDSMKHIVDRAMDAGAIGMSTGLYYAPGSYSSTGEVIDLAKVAAAKGGLYDSHIRDESSYTIGLIAAVNEVIQIGREAHMPVHISHIKALGTDVWGQSDTVIKLMKSARVSGIDITGGQYPYTASGTSVGASLLPRWAEVGGTDSLRARIKDPATHAKLVTEMTENMRRRGGANSLLITGGRDSTIRGKRLDEVAKARKTTPIEAAMQIILNGDAGVASFNMNEKDIENFMKQDFIVTDSDGSDGHPRKYGTFPKIFHEYVREKHVLTLPQAVKRSSATTAKILGLKDRGLLAPNYFADVVVFDPTTFADRSTYEQPTLLATGVKYLFVNGVLAVDGGKYTGVTAGRVLRH
ncbi:MAG TPA: D-aminoacylase [Gemmatimonadaceae bacterium]